MGVPANYELLASEKQFVQLPAEPKKTGSTEGPAYGDAIVWDNTNNYWKKAVAASVGRFGFNGNNQVLTHSINVLTGADTSTRGSTDAETNTSVVVQGKIYRLSEGTIVGGKAVMLGSTDPLSHVKQWDGVAANAIVGIYIMNMTQHHDADVVIPTSAAEDVITIDFKARESA
jgi:hypothetical protein